MTEAHDDPSEAFTDVHRRLRALTRRLNPADENLHFAPRLEGIGPEVFRELAALADEGLRLVLQHESWFLQDGEGETRLYDEGMFWYDLFLLISAASLSVPRDVTVPEPVLERLVEILVNISRFVGLPEYRDIVKRNHEALGNLMIGFPTPQLRALARRRARQSPVIAEFVEHTISRVEEVEAERSRKHAGPPGP